MHCLQSREQYYDEKADLISLLVVLVYLVPGSDHGECLVTCCNTVVPRELFKRVYMRPEELRTLRIA